MLLAGRLNNLNILPCDPTYDPSPPVDLSQVYDLSPISETLSKLSIFEISTRLGLGDGQPGIPPISVFNARRSEIAVLGPSRTK